MESNHHCILRGDMSYPLNDDPIKVHYITVSKNML